MKVTTVATIFSLLLGFGLGYLVTNNKVAATNTPTSHSSSMSHAMISMTSSLQAKKGDEFDKAFIEEMIVHHEGAIEMARLALEHAKHTEIKTLAQAIIDAQSQEITTMGNWLKSWYSTE